MKPNKTDLDFQEPSNETTFVYEARVPLRCISTSKQEFIHRSAKDLKKPLRLFATHLALIEQQLLTRSSKMTNFNFCIIDQCQ